MRQREWIPVALGGLIFVSLFAFLEVVGPAAALAWIDDLSDTATAMLIALGVAGCATALAFAIEIHGIARRARLLATVFDAMAQSVCVLDEEARLVCCNRRYMEMCKLAPDRFWRGRPLRDILEERRPIGTFSGDSEAYIRESRRRVGEGRTGQIIIERQGRTFSTLERPMPGGGWVATHFDITERMTAEHQRAAMLEQEQHRSMIDSAILGFRDHVESLLKTVNDGASRMRATATTLFASSQQTSERVDAAVQTSNEAASNVESAAYAADELSSSIGEVSRQLTQTNDVVREAAAEAQATNNEIAELANAAQKIGDIVKMIQDIAGQTNLLALNATIEAARAGEAGRGFAVVAAEVKSLAVQTAKATEEIAGQIAAVQASATAVVSAIRLLTERMQDISHHSSAVAVSLQQQNAATGEITQNVASASHGAQGIASTLNEVAGAATETRRSAQTVLEAAESVQTAADDLRREVHTFLQKVTV